MPTNYILVDLENVQPSNLEVCLDHATSFNVIVFVGASQKNITSNIAFVMQKLGQSGQYVQIAGNGKNALDFHIAYYLGKLAEQEPQAFFYIISRDRGFEPLIQHLKSKKISAQRVCDLVEIPAFQLSTAISNDDKFTAIVKNLAGRGQSRPRRLNTLSNTINAIFQEKEKLSEQQMVALLKKLEQKKYITVSDGKVSYTKNAFKTVSNN